MQLVVVRADLDGHLKALKNYFLLAKGDFFQVRYGHCHFVQPCTFCVAVCVIRIGKCLESFTF